LKLVRPIVASKPWLATCEALLRPVTRND